MCSESLVLRDHVKDGEGCNWCKEMVSGCMVGVKMVKIYEMQEVGLICGLGG